MRQKERRQQLRAISKVHSTTGSILMEPALTNTCGMVIPHELASENETEIKSHTPRMVHTIKCHTPYQMTLISDRRNGGSNYTCSKRTFDATSHRRFAMKTMIRQRQFTDVGYEHASVASGMTTGKWTGTYICFGWRTVLLLNDEEQYSEPSNSQHSRLRKKFLTNNATCSDQRLRSPVIKSTENFARG